MVTALKKAYPQKAADAYERISAINGQHPLKEEVLGAYVEYKARKRKNGRVAYFNYELAKDMGLISKSHDHKLNAALERTLLDTFAIQIINEHDIIQNTKFPDSEIKEHTYMATRYLQLQHPNKTGLTSGDGRSIWNGTHKHGGKSWDISSCGTGATCLSPATAINDRFFRTGDPFVSYGCGYSEISEGLGNAIFSEIFYRNGIKSERTLLVIEFPRGLSINVRVAENLLRPSHFFNHLKQEQYSRLKACVDLYIRRQVENGEFPKVQGDKARYQELLRSVTRTFAEMAAKFEVEYIFCWLDWDGDNILTDGSIIDYGSIRQFGLFHHEYRFDDVERWSTTITEQKSKARYTVQTFAQLVDYLVSQRKKPISRFAKNAALKEFERIFIRERKRLLLEKIGFTSDIANALVDQHNALVTKFQKSFAYFERSTSSRGPIRLEDGVTRNAIFCMRDVLRELPIHFRDEKVLLNADELIAIMRSSYATRKDLKLTSQKRMHARKLQTHYLALVTAAAKQKRLDVDAMLDLLIARSNMINRHDRITGDAMIHIASKLVRHRHKMPQQQLQAMIETFIAEQVLLPGQTKRSLRDVNKQDTLVEKLLISFQRLIHEYREGL